MLKLKLFILSMLLLLSACSQNKDDSRSHIWLARVGNDYLTLQEARTAIPSFVMKKDSITAIQNYTRQWIEQRLMLQKVYELQLADQQAVQQRLQNARERILTSALRQIVLEQYEAQYSVSDKEALQYYKSNRQQFILQERYVQFRHLSTSNIKYARAAHQELLSGKPWPEVARLYSEDAEQRIKQSQRYWPQSVVLNEFAVLESYVARLDSGQISPVRRLNGKYHFIQLTGARDAGEAAKPEWIIKQLKEWIMLEKKQQYFNSYIKNLYLTAMQHNEIELYNVSKLNETPTEPGRN